MGVNLRSVTAQCLGCCCCGAEGLGEHWLSHRYLEDLWGSLFQLMAYGEASSIRTRETSGEGGVLPRHLALGVPRPRP